MKVASIEEKKESPKKETKISICDVMRNNTSAIIKKAEFQIPSYAQLYSDLYTEYLHSIDDIYGTCYISEKEFFDRLGIDQNILRSLDDYFKSMTSVYSSQIDFSTSILRTYVQMGISTIKSYDGFMHAMMDSYAKMLSQFSETFKK